MCLKTKRFFSKKFATKDIVVYKHLRGDGKIFSTPYRDVKVDVPSIVTSQLKREKLGYYCKFWETTISKGIHSFKSKEDCIDDAREEGSQYVVECIIPKGSFYYIGDFNAKVAYTSNKLRYTNNIENISACH